MRIRTLLALALVALPGFAALRAAEPPLPDGLYAEFTTPRGVVTAELFFRQTPPRSPVSSAWPKARWDLARGGPILKT